MSQMKMLDEICGKKGQIDFDGELIPEWGKEAHLI